MIRTTSAPILLSIALYERRHYILVHEVLPYWSVISRYLHRWRKTIPRRLRHMHFIGGVTGQSGDIEDVFEREYIATVTDHASDSATEIGPLYANGSRTPLSRKATILRRADEPPQPIGALSPQSPQRLQRSQTQLSIARIVGSMNTTLARVYNRDTSAAGPLSQTHGTTKRGLWRRRASDVGYDRHLRQITERDEEELRFKQGSGQSNVQDQLDALQEQNNQLMKQQQNLQDMVQALLDMNQGRVLPAKLLQRTARTAGSILSEQSL